jgi:putative transposase
MRAAGLHARGRRRFIVTTQSRHNFAIAPNRVRRRFRPRRLNRVWAADMTACRLQYGWCYLAVVLDLASRRIVGWAVQRTAAPDLVIAALTPALPRVPPGATLLHHSDRGIQYASDRFRAVLACHRITPSMSRTGDCWDNAPVESFFSSFKAEASPDHPWTDLHAATAAIGDYMTFYNHRRLHSTLNYQSPVAFEERLALTV